MRRSAGHISRRGERNASKTVDFYAARLRVLLSRRGAPTGLEKYRLADLTSGRQAVFVLRAVEVAKIAAHCRMPARFFFDLAIGILR